MNPLSRSVAESHVGRETARVTRLLLLHSAIGLRPAVLDFADQLRERGHEVIAPDYYDGQIFDDTADGIAYRDEVGPKVLLQRLQPVLQELPPDTALAGFSLGAAFAQHLATRRPETPALFLLHSVAAPRQEWPGIPVQVHRYVEDAWIAQNELADLHSAVTASGAAFEDVTVPGRGHLFTDPELPDGNAEATAGAIDRMDAWLQQPPQRG